MTPSSTPARIRLGLMGFGRIGRNLYRLAADRPGLDIVVISDLGNPKILHYLLQRDSIHGSFPSQPQLDGDWLILQDGRQARMVSGVTPADVNWGRFRVDVVVDATGKYTGRSAMQGHLESGAPRVIIANLPQDDIDRIVISGINDHEIQASDKLVSAGSSTTNAAALLLDALGAKFDVECAMMTSVHAYTSDQPLQDTAGHDFRRSRSAAKNIIPNDSATPRWLKTILPQYKGRIEGIALNVPVADGSYADMTVQLSSPGVTAEEINAAADESAHRLPDIFETTADPIVSSDIIGNTHSVIFDQQATLVTKRGMVKVLGWYDNGWGHAARILDIVLAYAGLNDNGTGT